MYVTVHATLPTLMRKQPEDYAMSNTINLIATQAVNTWTTELKGSENTLNIPNDADVTTLQADIAQAGTIELHFPKFTDGRAYSQAVQLRRRLGFKGDIRATGEVLIDQLVQMQRSGFSSAVLRDDQDAVHGAKLLAQYSGFYQGDDSAGVQHAKPQFAKVAA
jgi:uncharacterized protein (DUF934 family)